MLWVDDNPPNNQLELQILGDLGIRFVTALSTQEAMESKIDCSNRLNFEVNYRISSIAAFAGNVFATVAHGKYSGGSQIC